MLALCVLVNNIFDILISEFSIMFNFKVTVLLESIDLRNYMRALTYFQGFEPYTFNIHPICWHNPLAFYTFCYADILAQA